MGALRVVAAIIALLLVPAGRSAADCCAGGHVQFLVNGAQFGYGGGLAVGRTATPFAGVLNPRYASTQQVAGPIAQAGPSAYFARRAFVNVPQLEALAIAAEQRELAIASDAALFDPQPAEGVDPGDGRDDSPAFSPGQAFWQLEARARLGAGPLVASDDSEAASQSTESRPPNRSAATPTAIPRQVAHRSRTTLPPRRATGIYASESAARIARSLPSGGLGL